MPRSTIAQRRTVGFDKNLMLRDYNAAAVSATTFETAIALDLISYEDWVVVVDIAAHTGYVASTSLWTITIQVAVDSGFSVTSTVISYLYTNGNQAHFDVPLAGLFASEQLGGAMPQYIRIVATKNGTPGNLTYGAYIGNVACG